MTVEPLVRVVSVEQVETPFALIANTRGGKRAIFLNHACLSLGYPQRNRVTRDCQVIPNVFSECFSHTQIERVFDTSGSTLGTVSSMAGAGIGASARLRYINTVAERIINNLKESLDKPVGII